MNEVHVFIDGSNVNGSMARLGFVGVDAAALRTWAKQFGDAEVHWFQGAYPRTRPFFAHLRSAGVRVHCKTPKTLPGGRRKANMDVEIALAAAEATGTVVLVTADGDFAPLVRRLRSRGCEVVLVAPRTGTARELRAEFDRADVVDLDDALLSFGRWSEAA